MFKYILQRVGLMVVTMLVIITLCFFAIRLMPGSPFSDPDLSPEIERMMEDRYHLNDPIVVQYYYFWRDILVDNFWGVSLKLSPQMPVWDILIDRIPVTLIMNLAALFLSVPVGILFGTIAALNKSRWPDTLISIMVILCISIPSFVFASGLQYFIGFKGQYLPMIYNGMGNLKEKTISMVMPILALGFGPVSTITRYLRGELIEVMSSEYLLLARTKGLKKYQCIFRHAFRNSLVPLMNVIVPMFTTIMSGSLVLENIFSIPGTGKILAASLQSADHWLTIACLVFYTAINMITHLITDLSYGLVDPRIRLGGLK